jgi:hypothetical protein
MYRSPFVDMFQDWLVIGLIWTLLMLSYIIAYGRLC